ncbi:hypothetical protein QJS66_13095 [Kocuria rhizophila]|nr:hypothetical protein QJS66_13095 [Kocuria rhizophila]
MELFRGCRRDGSLRVGLRAGEAYSVGVGVGVGAGRGFGGSVGVRRVEQRGGWRRKVSRATACHGRAGRERADRPPRRL